MKTSFDCQMGCVPDLSQWFQDIWNLEWQRIPAWRSKMHRLSPADPAQVPAAGRNNRGKTFHPAVAMSNPDHKLPAKDAA
jgi:hypothetical protein